MIFLAVRDGCDCKTIMMEGEKLLSNKMLRREIHKARIAGKALRILKCSFDWKLYEQQQQIEYQAKKSF